MDLYLCTYDKHAIWFRGRDRRRYVRNKGSRITKKWNKDGAVAIPVQFMVWMINIWEEVRNRGRRILWVLIGYGDMWTFKIVFIWEEWRGGWEAFVGTIIGWWWEWGSITMGKGGRVWCVYLTLEGWSHCRHWRITSTRIKTLTSKMGTSLPIQRATNNYMKNSVLMMIEATTTSAVRMWTETYCFPALKEDVEGHWRRQQVVERWRKWLRLKFTVVLSSMKTTASTKIMARNEMKNMRTAWLV